MYNFSSFQAPLMCGSREGDRGSGPSLKNQQNIRFSSKTGPDPLKNCSYQASIQCWVLSSTPAKRHIMVFHWRAYDGPLIVVPGSSLPSSTKKTTKKRQSWTPSDKTFWIRHATISGPRIILGILTYSLNCLVLVYMNPTYVYTLNIHIFYFRLTRRLSIKLLKDI